VAQKSFQDAMNENLQFIRRALHRIEAGEAPETELRNVRVYLMHTLDLIEPDSRITESADELSRLVTKCALEQGREVLTQEAHVPDRAHAMNDAFARLRVALAAARPNDQALRMGLH
ncbi:MAG TPA: hypothetical protein VHN13_13470, partial [Candidatus Tectomicrobia bacterium]|nr:hypothetical protein [Candidatus Tectomicrobia bacterium]